MWTGPVDLEREQEVLVAWQGLVKQASERMVQVLEALHNFLHRDCWDGTHRLCSYKIHNNR